MNVTVSAARQQAVRGGRLDSPRQLWHLTVRVKGHTPVDGGADQIASLEIKAIGTNPEGATVPVHFRVVPPVRVIPERFFFGRATSADELSRTVTVVFAPNAIPGCARDIALSCDPTDAVEIEWQRTEGRAWELRATFQPGDVERDVSAVVTVDFSSDILPKLRLPVYAIVRPKDVH